MNTQEVADLAGVPASTLRGWFRREIALRESSEIPDGDGLPSNIGPATAGKIIALAALVRVGFHERAASSLIYGGLSHG